MWQMLHVEKSGIGSNFVTEPLTNKAIDKYFSAIPAIVGATLSHFVNHALQHEMQGIMRKMSVLKDEVQRDKVIEEAYDRCMIDRLKQLLVYAPYLKCYHQVPIVTVKGKFKNEPCAFSPFVPKLSFVVEQNDMGIFYISTFININEHLTSLLEFARRKYLLNYKQEYFLLQYKDYKTLEWIESQDWEQMGQQLDVFTEEIVRRLEVEYRVDRNELIHRTIIDEEPECVVLMSELSGAYLMLTPQFVYDSFRIDGNYKVEDIRTRDGVEYEIVRKENAEKQFIDRLIGLHVNFKEQPNGYFYLTFADAQKKHWFLKTYQQLLADNVQILGMDMLKHFRYSKEKIETTIQHIEELKNIVTLQFEVHFGKEKVSLTELQKMLRNQQTAVVLKDDSIGVFDEEWIRKYAILIKHGQIEKDFLKAPKWLAISTNTSSNEIDNGPMQISTEWWDKWRTWQDVNATLYDVPKSVKATLRPYQAKGYEWMQLLTEIGAGACLADDMGLGKTLQTICFLAKQLEANPNAKMLIVAPASLLYNWQNELLKFAPSIATTIYHGGSRNKEYFKDASTRILITSYGTVRADIDFLRDILFTSIVLDESHSIKSPGAQITKAVHALGATTRVLLSGTPIMNNTFDLYSQLHFALPSMFGSAEFFKREYAEPIDVRKDNNKIKLLQKLTAPFILRRTKEQVAKDLPPKTEITLWCEMEKSQREVYENIRARVAGEISGLIRTDGLSKSKLAVLQGIMKLRQACNTPALLPEAEYNSVTDSAKQDVLIEELLNNLSNHKALVFSQFTTMLDIIAKTLRQKGIPFLMLTGQTPPKARGQMVDDFNAVDSKYKVFLLSLKAGNAGLNLTSADYVFLFDPWWNTAVEQQAIDRTHRIGQTKNVFAYKMICKNTIEEKIIKLQERKQKLSDELISEEDGFVKSLSEADIAFLFE